MFRYTVDLICTAGSSGDLTRYALINTVAFVAVQEFSHKCMRIGSFVAVHGSRWKLPEAAAIVSHVGFLQRYESKTNLEIFLFNGQSNAFVNYELSCSAVKEKEYGIVISRISRVFFHFIA